MIQLRDKTNYGIITGWLYDNQVVRVYLANGIFMQMAVALIGFKILEGLSNRKEKIKLAVIILAIIVSNTRGYWLGFSLVFLLTFIYAKNKIKYIKYLIIILIIISGIFIKFGMMQYFTDRITSITNFSTEVSNIQRKYQSQLIKEGIKENPILGHGVGSKIEGYYELTGRDAENIEMFYHEMVYKAGILGLIIYLTIIGIPILKILFGKKNINSVEQTYLYGWTIGLISILITSITNPYLKGANGFFVIVMFFIIYNVFLDEEDSLETK
jgi:O-antigen ligase